MRGELLMRPTNKHTRDRVVLFLHVPKTAGGTVSGMFYGQSDRDSIARGNEKFYSYGVYHYPGRHWGKSRAGFLKEPDFGFPSGVLADLKRLDVRAVVGHFAFGLHRFIDESCTYVTVLREPVDRVVSLYHHVVKSLEPVSIEDFLERYEVPGYDLDQTRLMTDNDQTRRLAGVEPPFRECSRETLETAKLNLRRHFLVVGLTDRFAETSVLLKRTLGWKKDLAVWPRHINLERPPASSLPAEILETIRQRNVLDIELYRYAQQLFEEHPARSDDSFEQDVREFEWRQKNFVDRLGEAKPKVAEGIDGALRRVAESRSDTE